jgi:hypothetical protein
VREDAAVDGLDEDLVRRLVDEHLRQHARAGALYHSDAGFHAAVDNARCTLVAVAGSMRACRMPFWQAEAVLCGALDRLLSDEVLAEHEQRVELLRQSVVMAAARAPR